MEETIIMVSHGKALETSKVLKTSESMPLISLNRRVGYETAKKICYVTTTKERNMEGWR